MIACFSQQREHKYLCSLLLIAFFIYKDSKVGHARYLCLYGMLIATLT